MLATGIDIARQLGASVSDEEYKRLRDVEQVFRKWFNDNIMTADDQTKSDAVMLMPYVREMTTLTSV